jgi:Predicted ABC-type sugar transport system, permease component
MSVNGQVGEKVWKSRMVRLFNIMGILPIIILICLFFMSQTDRFLVFDNFVNIFRAASINIVLAAGMTLVILTGGIDLSIGSILAVSSAVALQLSLMPEWVHFDWIIAIALGLILGMINGAIIALIDLAPFIVTMGTMTALRGVAHFICGGHAVINIDLNYAWLGNDSLMGIPWLVIFALLSIVVCWFILRKTVLGERIYAIGGNAAAARLTGINVALILIIVYGISGLLCGAAGVMVTSRLNAANGLLGTGYELDAIASVVLGGTSMSGGVGGVGGTLLGALLIAIINNGLVLMNVSHFSQLIIKGLIIIFAVILDKYRNR